MYTSPIIWMLTWPVLLIISYQLIKIVVRKFEKKLEVTEKQE